MLAKLTDPRTRFPLVTTVGVLADVVIFLVALRAGVTAAPS